MFQLPVHLKEAFKNFPDLKEKYSDYSSLTTGSLHYLTYAGLTGHGMLYVMFFMFTTTAKLIRKIRFETFIHTHHLYVLFYTFLFLHSFGCFFRSPGGECKGYNTKYYIAPVFLFFLIDRMIRVYRSREDTHISDVIIHAGKVVELRFEKPSMIYNPGQYLYINIPEISKFQWHPFTISSTPQEGFISVHIKVVGDWTGALYNIVNSSKNQFPSIRVDGPFGAPAQDLFRYETSVLVSAGIGVTPSAGLLKSVWYAYMRKAPMKLKKLHLIWVCRDMQDIACFQSLLYTMEENIPASFVDSQIYLTGKLGSTDIANIMYNESNDKFDQITQLRSKTLFGRPQWEKIFESIKDEINPVKKKNEVGIFFCGPPVMGEALKKQANRSSTKFCKFIIHEENFE
jgi:NADPH oxidase